VRRILLRLLQNLVELYENNLATLGAIKVPALGAWSRRPFLASRPGARPSSSSPRGVRLHRQGRSLTSRAASGGGCQRVKQRGRTRSILVALEASANEKPVFCLAGDVAVWDYGDSLTGG
jgi:hypothetical protein